MHAADGRLVYLTRSLPDHRLLQNSLVNESLLRDTQLPLEADAHKEIQLLCVMEIAQSKGMLNQILVRSRRIESSDSLQPIKQGSGINADELVTAHLMTNTSAHSGAAAGEPVPTITSAGNQAVVECTLSREQEAGALRVAAFLVKYYGSGIAVDPRDPLDTVTTKDRLALVTVVIKGTPYVIVDIGLRMLKPHELYRAQGFPVGYIIDRTADGTPLTTSAAVRMVGNSVSPPPLRALAEANLDPAYIPLAVAA